MKEKNDHYHFFASKPKIDTSGIQTMVKEYTAVVEKIILQYPEQWFNYYDFWGNENLD